MRHTIELISTPSDEYEGSYRMTGCDGIPAPEGYASEWYAVAKSIYNDTDFGSYGNLAFVLRHDGFHIWRSRKRVWRPHVISMAKQDSIAFARHIFGTLVKNEDEGEPGAIRSYNIPGIVGGLLVAGLTSRVVDGIIGE